MYWKNSRYHLEEKIRIGEEKNWKLETKKEKQQNKKRNAQVIR
jgi:hypothetical protein